jgi:chromosome segregation ATPase
MTRHEIKLFLEENTQLRAQLKKCSETVQGLERNLNAEVNTKIHVVKQLNVKSDALEESRKATAQLRSELHALREQNACLRAAFEPADHAAKIARDEANRVIEALKKAEAEVARLKPSSERVLSLQKKLFDVREEFRNFRAQLVSMARDYHEID